MCSNVGLFEIVLIASNMIDIPSVEAKYFLSNKRQNCSDGE